MTGLSCDAIFAAEVAHSLHSSLSSLGWVCGGPVAVVQALLDVLGPDGTLVVPTHSGENSDPAQWENPPVPPSWWPMIRAHTPAYDPAVTPSAGVGVIPETVRRWPDALRSAHPRTSFAAVGLAARDVIRDHRLDHQLGEESPLGRIYALDGDVLLLGVGHGCNTSMHLAEYRVPSSPTVPHSAAIRTPDGERRSVTWTDVDVEADDFEFLGADFEADASARAGARATSGTVGSAECRLVRQREVVDYATGWMAKTATLDMSVPHECDVPHRTHSHCRAGRRDLSLP